MMKTQFQKDMSSETEEVFAQQFYPKIDIHQ